MRQLGGFQQPVMSPSVLFQPNGPVSGQAVERQSASADKALRATATSRIKLVPPPRVYPSGCLFFSYAGKRVRTRLVRCGESRTLEHPQARLRCERCPHQECALLFGHVGRIPSGV
jgi:hypothetical protein